MSAPMQPLLIEIGTEELPIHALPGLAQALFDGVLEALGARGIAVERGDAKPLYSPRRLAVLLPGVAVEQPEQHAEVLGPYRNIALDADGRPTRALEGFAQKNGVDWTQLATTTDAKGERFVLRRVLPAQATTALLPAVLTDAVAALPIPRPMRWGDHAFRFARPVHWLVLLFGDAVVDCTLFGCNADRMSRGHRFMHPRPVWIGRPEDYLGALRGAKVLVDPDERRARIVAEVEQAARAAGGTARISEDNLAQVNALVESPHAIHCTFEEGFLAVPQEALIATMEANQKFFPVLDAGGRLTAHFIGVANLASRDPVQVRQGYERVIRPRFADAKFFFDEDLKQGLTAMGEGLKTVTYQATLGTVADKVARVAALAALIAPQVGVDPALAMRAAQVSKNDLQSRLVNEFPELQGIAGRHYALHDAALEDLAAGQRASLAAALDEAYMPRFAGDTIAPSRLGQVLAIAERLDTLAGGFAAGLKPTGNKDPFALRRTALGLARTLIEGELDLDLLAEVRSGDAVSAVGFLQVAYRQAVEAIGKAALDKKLQSAAHAATQGVEVDPFQSAPTTFDRAVPGELHDFILDRLRGYYADKGVPAAHFNAVAELKPTSLLDFDRRLDAIGTFAQLPEAAALAAANKRIGNILKKADGTIPVAVDAALFQEGAERALHEAVERAIADTDPLLAAHDYGAVLARLAALRPAVDAFFDGVMVNADDPALRGNRLALLKRLADRLGSVAAIEHLSS
jgi:glycyl-tRNA synthetase beta chain